MDESMLHGMTYGALGLSVLAAVGWFFFNLLKGQVKKVDAEASIDDRTAKIAGIFEPMLAQEREEKNRLQDRLEKANDRFADVVAGQFDRQQKAIDGVREEARQASQRLHDRLDQCEKKHAECETATSLLRDQVRQMQPTQLSVTAAPGAALTVGPATGPSP